MTRVGAQLSGRPVVRFAKAVANKRGTAASWPVAHAWLERECRPAGQVPAAEAACPNPHNLRPRTCISITLLSMKCSCGSPCSFVAAVAANDAGCACSKAQAERLSVCVGGATGCLPTIQLQPRSGDLCAGHPATANPCPKASNHPYSFPHHQPSPATYAQIAHRTCARAHQSSLKSPTRRRTATSCGRKEAE